MKHSKIAIIGAGRVGTTTAYALMLKNIAAEILLVDVDPIRCKGEFLDLSDVLPFSSTSIVRDATLQEAAQADIIIITGGKAQSPGQTRLDLLKINLKVMDAIVDGLASLNKNAIIIVISNPLDILTQHIQNKNILPRNQIFGSGTFLDSTRLQGALGLKLNVAPKSIHAYILGEHGDTQFPAWSSAYCDGKSISECLSRNELEQVAQQTKQKAYDIISCKGSTFYGIASCATALCESIIFNQKQVIPVSCYQEDLGVCLSVPCVIGEKGIVELFPLSLNAQEKNQLQQSAQNLKALMQP
ncbi:MAG: L-lactate dehydrogenase [Candidatus Dependentiae bacterium]|nr:L-lactate dehydrogenase [Candidatus Dependentiae bacterium]